jgi:hypothetical protein
MSASSRTVLHPWAAAHRTVLFVTGLLVVLAAAALTVSLLLISGSGSPAQAPARVPAPIAHDAPPQAPANPCEVIKPGRPRPC